MFNGAFSDSENGLENSQEGYMLRKIMSMRKVTQVWPPCQYVTFCIGCFKSFRKNRAVAS